MTRLTKDQLETLTRLRRDLHANPETAGLEAVTARRIHRAIEPLEPDDTLTSLGGHGVAALFKGTTDAAPVLIRCELDALPIPESIDLPYASMSEGVSHKCGHDGHMAIVTACAHMQRAAKEAGEDAPTLICLYQPAEENGAGAKAVHEDGRLDAWSPRKAIALHNHPGYSMGAIIVREGTICAASVGIRIELKGATTHASTPHLGRSPAQALARTAIRIEEIPTTQDSVEFITITTINTGGDFGIAPGVGHLGVTARAETDDALAGLIDEIETIANEEAKRDALEIDITHHDRFPACVNEAETVEAIRVTAKSLKMKTIELDQPIAFSEDFAHTINAYTGALFTLGSGEKQPPLHNIEYDFPDELIEPGAKILYETAKRLSEQAANTP